jgi:hypothetical protein
MTVNLNGTVRDFATLAPIEGALVRVLAADQSFIDEVLTDSNGEYSIDLAAATVYLGFDADGYTGRFHQDAANFESATGVDLTLDPVTVDALLVAIPASASGYSLGTVALWLGSATAFQRPSFVSRVTLLSDGSGLPAESLQSGSMPRRSATWDLPWIESADLATLQGYHTAVTVVQCVTPEETLNVVILELPEADKLAPGLWSISGMVLVEVP